jgi:hypothetical protein
MVLNIIDTVNKMAKAYGDLVPPMPDRYFPDLDIVTNPDRAIGSLDVLGELLKNQDWSDLLLLFNCSGTGPRHSYWCEVHCKRDVKRGMGFKYHYKREPIRIHYQRD